MVDGDDEAISQIGGAGMEGESRQMKGWLTKGTKEEVDEEALVSGGAGSAKGKSKEVPRPDRWLVVVGTYSVGKERIVKSTFRPSSSPLFTTDEDVDRHRRLAKNENLRQSDKDEITPRAGRRPPRFTPDDRPPPCASARRLPLLDHKRTPRSLPRPISTSPQRLHQTHRSTTDRVDLSTGERCGWEYDFGGAVEGEYENSESGWNDSSEGFETWLFGFWGALF